MQIQGVCLRAWNRVEPPGSNPLSFTKLVQNTNEPYTDFLSRLRKTVNRAVADPNVQDILLRTLSYENANSECEKALRPLKVQGAPLDEFIKAYHDIGSLPHHAHLLASALKDGLQGSTQKYYNCGKLGHFHKDCKKNKNGKNGNGNRANNLPTSKNLPTGLFRRCGKGFPWTNEC